MAQFRMLKGISTALPVVSADTEGTIFYTYDDSLFHLDYKNENGEIVRKTLNAEHTKKLIEARNITLTGDVSGSISFDGSEDVIIETTIANNFAVKEDLAALEAILNRKIEEALGQIESQFKLVTYENMITVASARQTTFDTGFETFDPKEDTLQVHHGRLYLTAGEDYVLSGRQVVLNEAPEVGDTLTFTLFKNVPILEDEITFSPGLLEDGSIPLSKLEEMPAINVNIKTYNNLDQIGLSNDDMSATDFLANIKAINTALGEDDSILYLTTTNADNLHLSTVDKLNADTGKELGYDIIEGNDEFVAFGSDRNSGLNIVVSSEDGINWTESQLNNPFKESQAYFAYGNGKFVAIQKDSNKTAYSEDGINWTENLLANEYYYYQLAYGNGKFIAFGFGGADTFVVAHSEDGIHWTEVIQNNFPYGMDLLAYGNGKFVAVSSGYYASTAIYSEDGINWTEVAMPAASTYLSLAYGNGKFIAISREIMAHSEDGIHWTEVQVNFPYGIGLIAYGNGKFVAVSSNSIVRYSEDGINWTTSESMLNSITECYSMICIKKITKQYTSVPLSIKISRTGNAYNAITIDLIYNSGVEATYIYSCVYNKEADEADDTLSKFVITTHPKGFVSKEEVSSDAAMKLLYELGVIDPIINSDGEILTDENGNIFVF